VIKIKICGITTLEDAMTCVEAGADALGFIFVEDTPRFITPAAAAAIIRVLPPFVTSVGVFWDHPRGHVKAVAEACRLSALQFHGAEAPEDLADYTLPVIKTIKVSGPQDLARMMTYWKQVAAFLLDSAARWSDGEPRQPIEWRLARMASGGHQAGTLPRVILSAGLTPDNVARAIAIARPYAVDVNSGVEARPGRKDPDKVWRFVAEARRTQ
jgi:phosphoribosylanthranilate isomerase